MTIDINSRYKTLTGKDLDKDPTALIDQYRSQYPQLDDRYISAAVSLDLAGEGETTNKYLQSKSRSFRDKALGIDEGPIYDKHGRNIPSLIYDLARGGEVQPIEYKPNPISEVNYQNPLGTDRFSAAEAFGAGTFRNSALANAGAIQAARQFNESKQMDPDSKFIRIGDIEVDPVQLAIDRGYAPYAEGFANVTSKEEFIEALEMVETMELVSEATAEHPIAGTLGAIAGAAGEVIVLPNVFGKAVAAGKITSTLKGLMLGTALATSETVLQEYMLQNSDPTRTIEETEQNIIAAALLGGGIGGVFGTIGGRAHRETQLILEDIDAVSKGQLPPNQIRQAREQGYTGNDKEVYEKFRRDLEERAEGGFLDYDATQELDDGVLRTKEADNYLGRLFQRLTTPLSQSRRARRLNSKAINNFAAQMTETTEKTRGGPVNTGTSIEAMRDNTQLSLFNFVTEMNKMNKPLRKFLDTNGLDSSEDGISILLKDRVAREDYSPLIGKNGEQFDIAAPAQALRKSLDDMGEVMVTAGMKIDPEEIRIKAGERYVPDTIDRSKVFDPQVKKELTSTFEDIVSSTNKSLDEFDSVQFKENFNKISNADSKAWYEIPYLRYLGSKFKDDELWKGLKEELHKIKGIDKKLISKLVKDKNLDEIRKIGDNAANTMAKHFEVKARSIAKSKIGDKTGKNLLDTYTAQNKGKGALEDAEKGNRRVRKRDYIIPRHLLTKILSNDLNRDMTQYLEEMSVTVGIKRKFGVDSVDAMKKKVKKDVDSEYAEKIKNSKSTQEEQKMIEERKEALALVDSITDTITHKYTRESFLTKGQKNKLAMFKRYMNFKSLQSAAMSAIPELGTAHAESISKQFVRNKLVKDNIKLLQDNAKLLESPAGKNLLAQLGVVSEEMAFLTRNRAAGIDDDITNDSRIIRALDTATSWMYKLTGQTKLTTYVREMVATGALLDMSVAAKALRDGTDEAFVESVLSRYNIDRSRLKQIDEIFQRRKITLEDAEFANLEGWTSDELEVILSPILNDISKVSAIPYKTNMPAWMQGPVGSTIFMFQTFIFNLTAQQTAYRAQNFNANRAYFSALIATQLAFGSLSMAVKDISRGADPMERFADPDKYALHLMQYSGIAGILGDAPALLQQTLGNGRPDAFLDRQSASYGFLGDLIGASQIVMNGGRGSESDWRAVTNLLPTATTPFLRALHDDIINNLPKE